MRNALEEALERLGVRVRREPLPIEARIGGGLCTIRGQRTLILVPDLAEADEVAIFASALRTLDTSQLWLPPAVRELLERER